MDFLKCIPVRYGFCIINRNKQNLHIRINKDAPLLDDPIEWLMHRSNQHASMANVVALEDTTCWAVTAEDFTKTLGSYLSLINRTADKKILVRMTRNTSSIAMTTSQA